MNNPTLFFDSCIFIDCIESDRAAKIVTHAINAGYLVTTSITVLGETLTQLMEPSPETDKFVKFKERLDEWNVQFCFPNDLIRILCYQIGEHISPRDPLYNQVTDRTHLAYSIGYKSDFFITTDSELIDYRLPKELSDLDFTKPLTMTLDDFNRNNLIRKKKP